MVELVFEGPHLNPRDFRWILSADGSSNQHDSGAGVILEGPIGLLIEQSLKFAFKVSNNQAEHEALIARMLLAHELGTRNLLVKSDSLLVTEQVIKRYQAKDPQLVVYLQYVMLLREAFTQIELIHELREHNSQADLLAKLASSGKGNRQRSVIQKTLKSSRTAEDSLPKSGQAEVLEVNSRVGRSHRSLIQETLKVPRVVACQMREEKVVTVS